VAAGRFRADLYHRIAPPEVVLPPLRERLDDIVFHVVDEIARAAPGAMAQARLIEVCLLRHWPGNVRELRKHLRYAAIQALAERENRVRAEHLPASAGEPLSLATDAPPPVARVEPPADAGASPRPYVRWSESLTREDIERSLADVEGNVALAARRLGMGRSQLYREMKRCSIDMESLRRK
jgi:transcriptional regulator with GAF, ATPase, and Fis domain